MAYRCNNCGELFDEPKHSVEMHGFSYGPGENIYTCPYCGVDDMEETDEYAYSYEDYLADKADEEYDERHCMEDD